MYNLERSNEFKVKELDTEHPEYYDPYSFKNNLGITLNRMPLNFLLNLIYQTYLNRC